MNNHNREKFQTISSFKKEFGVHITTEHTGKMTGFASLSTSPMVNRFCQRRSKCKGSICEKCYSMKMQKMYSSLDKALVQNHDILTKQIIPVSKMPVLNYLMFRLEAFGDIENEVQVVNYFNLCRRNPRVQFTIWTKNTAIFAKLLDKGFKGKRVRKPDNLIIVVSSPFVNKPEDITRYPFADKVFTVYEKDYAMNHGIRINCGSKSCLNCGSNSCYDRHNRVVYVNELLK